jgi:RAB protein geranylgeranyltransferase component A
MPETSLLDESIAKLEALKKKRTSLKTKITRIQNFVANFQSNDNDVNPLKFRKTFIEQTFKDYEEVQTEIELLDSSTTAVETQTQDRVEIESKYFDVLLRAKKVGHQISVSFEKFDVVQALLSFF